MASWFTSNGITPIKPAPAGAAPGFAGSGTLPGTYTPPPGSFAIPGGWGGLIPSYSPSPTPWPTNPISSGPGGSIAPPGAGGGWPTGYDANGLKNPLPPGWQVNAMGVPFNPNGAPGSGLSIDPTSGPSGSVAPPAPPGGATPWLGSGPIASGPGGSVAPPGSGGTAAFPGFTPGGPAYTGPTGSEGPTVAPGTKPGGGYDPTAMHPTALTIPGTTPGAGFGTPPATGPGGTTAPPAPPGDTIPATGETPPPGYGWSADGSSWVRASPAGAPSTPGAGPSLSTSPANDADLRAWLTSQGITGDGQQYWIDSINSKPDGLQSGNAQYWMDKIKAGQAENAGGGSSAGGAGSAGGYGAFLAPYTGQFTAPTGTDDPGFQFALQQGTDAIQRSAAAKGNLLTGGTQKDLASYTTGAALQDYAGSYNRALNTFNTNYGIFKDNQDRPFGKLFDVTQLGYGAANGSNQALGAYGTNIGNLTSGYGSQSTNLTTSSGNANAGATAGNANGLNNAINTGANWFQNYQNPYLGY